MLFHCLDRCYDIVTDCTIFQLPLKIDIIKHKHEIDGKSTAAHAAVLAPEDVSIYTYPDIPSYENEKAVLIFPSFNAVEISKLFTDDCQLNESVCEASIEMSRMVHENTLITEKSMNPGDKKSEIKRMEMKNDELPITRAIFIDSTWNQSRGIYKDERIKRIPAVVIQNRISQFWRHQKGSPRWYLATIEAIHQFLLEVHLQAWGLHPDYKGLDNCFTETTLLQIDQLLVDRNDAKGYNGQYDDLLYFFQHMYDLIHLYYDHDNLYAYKRRLM